MEGVIEDKTKLFIHALDDLKNSGINREKYLSQTLTVVDSLLRSRQGLEVLYDNIEKIEHAGLFRDTNWEFADKLVPSLVGGTLISGFPMVIYESLSELRILKISQGALINDRMNSREAKQFISEAIITNLSYVFPDKLHSNQTPPDITENCRNRISLLFDFIFQYIPIDNLKTEMLKELKEQSAQRPIIVDRILDIINIVKDRVKSGNESELDLALCNFIDVIHAPTSLAREANSPDTYKLKLQSLSFDSLESEAKLLSNNMRETGLVSEYHFILCAFLVDKFPELIPLAIGLTAHGKADYDLHQKFIRFQLFPQILLETRQSLYGFSKMLNRNLLSRKALFNAIRKLLKTRLHPEVKRRLVNGDSASTEEDARACLMSGLYSVLGQPLGVGQGNNPTCQSARGISMWSKHSPGKLINLIISVVASNELKFRFQGEVLHSHGLVKENQFDYKLDPVSRILVPHLDDIYGQMMKLAQIRFPAQDPHISVNPAFYGLWIQTGFISCYNPLLNVIQYYENFVRTFYASYHPKYNGVNRLIYPVPLGIFITNAHGEFLGFHAVSLLRVQQSPTGEYRVYFYNPNNEGRQNWGQGIKTSVSDHGEQHGESSLLFHEFVSRVYAYHFNTSEAENHLNLVSGDEIREVEILARQSWGRNYFWDKN